MTTTRTSTRIRKAKSATENAAPKTEKKTAGTSKRKTAPADNETTTKKRKTKTEEKGSQKTSTKGTRRVLPKTKTAEVKPETPKKTRKPKQKVTLPAEALNLSKEMQGRVLRAMKQRMFVLSRKTSELDSSVEIFDVAGSVGNMYTVTVDTRISCTCMDFGFRKSYCKHILMVLMKVYRLPLSDPMFQSLKTSREQRIDARQTGNIADPSVLVPEDIRKKIMTIFYHQDESLDTQTNRRPLDNNDCPICFEAFEEDKIDTIDFCRVCGNNIHKECFDMWASSKGSRVTCVYCRSNWYTNSNSKKSGKKAAYELDSSHVNESGYANFAAELGLTKKRETTSFDSYDIDTI
ncbi:hypothetical protein EDC96DRAFT_517986 [Choanephora cucurbitarum]|nr:hypothetical protein EDC96DRAFT_517986 [Choanephora cucurbitarum]